MSNAVTDGTTQEWQAAPTTPGVPGAPAPKRVPVDVEWADIAKGHGDVYVVGHYIGVIPQYAEWALDCALSGTTDPSKLVLTDLTRRGAIRGALGDVIFFPLSGGKQVVLAGMGRPGAFKEGLLKTLVRTTLETICRIVPNPTVCMVLIGSGYGTLKVDEAVSGLFAGLSEALTSNPHLPLQRLRIVERNVDRAYEIVGRLRKTAEAAAAVPIDVAPDVIEEDKYGGVIPIPFGLSMMLASLAQACHEGAESPLYNTAESLIATLPEHLQTHVRVVLRRLGADSNSRRLGLAFRLGQNDINFGDRDTVTGLQNGPVGRADRVSYSHDGSALLRAAAITNLATVPERELDLQLAWVDRIVDDLHAALPDGLDDRATRAYRYLVHQDLNDKLAGRDEPLVVEVDRTMARVPWEMICEGPGNDPIGLKRPLARQLRTSYSPRIADPTERRTFRALVVGDPDDSLPYARKEATEVHELLKTKVNIDVELRLGAPDELGLGRVPGIKPADLFEIIALLLSGTFDFVHFAGHAVFDPDCPDRSGWLFAGAQILTPSKLANIAAVPRLIFANACLSGGLSRLRATPPKGRKSRRSAPADDAKRRTAAQGDSRLVASLADEFFRRGVADYIGTAWEVPEGPAELFAVTFYETLLGNHPSPVTLGKAMLTARAALRKSRVNWSAELQSTWAAYQHYGDPTRSLWD